VSDTPRTDLALRKAQEDCTESYLLTEGRQLERELNAANEMFRKLNIHALNLTDRIRRLEEAGDALYEGWIGYGFTKDKHLATWLKAKEAKPCIKQLKTKSCIYCMKVECECSDFDVSADMGAKG